MTDGQSATSIFQMAVTAPRRQPAEVRRDQILEAAEAVMLRKGLYDATISEIADTAGLGKGTIYLQFDSKQELAAGLRRRYVERIEEEVRSKIEQHEDAPDRLTAFVQSFASAATRRPDLHHLLFVEAGADETEAFSALRAMFAEIVKGCEFESRNIDLAIDFAFGGIHAAMIAIAHAPPARRTRATSQLAEIVARTLAS